MGKRIEKTGSNYMTRPISYSPYYRMGLCANVQITCSTQKMKLVAWTNIQNKLSQNVLLNVFLNRYTLMMHGPIYQNRLPKNS